MEKTSMINYIVKRIETEYKINNDKAKKIYDSYFNQNVYKHLKSEIDKQLKEKNIYFK